MEQRHLDRTQYFHELAHTSGKYFVPYIGQYHPIDRGTAVLEIGCGEGGNLLPFALCGCEVVGIDISVNRIREARELFAREGARGEFICSDIFDVTSCDSRFDIIICHDVVEHIGPKTALLARALRLLRHGGVMFVAFPAWHMPFGGHQQICRNRVVSRLPFIHLLPWRLFRLVLEWGGESEEMVRELLSIRRTRTTVEAFEKCLKTAGWEIADRRLYLVNPHYEVKYGLAPRVLPGIMGGVPYVRNLFSTSCFYVARSGAIS